MISLASLWGVWSAVSRFWTKETSNALIIGVAVVAVVIGAGVAFHTIKRTLVEARDGEWATKLGEANREHEKARERINAAAAEAAAFEREAAKRTLDDEMEARAALERTLAEMQTASGNDPVVIPKQLAKELRR